jgi:hypothetical protein
MTVPEIAIEDLNSSGDEGKFYISYRVTLPAYMLLQPGRHRQLSAPTTKVALISVLTALSLGTNYLMIDVPNVKLMDSIVFIGAFLFGLDVGVATGTSIWLVYGFVNPYGQDSLILLSFLIAGESFYAIAGALLKRTRAATQFLTGGNYRHATIVFGGLGLVTTFAYDALTNFGDKLPFTNSLYQAFLIGMITGAPFALFHELSNVAFFATIVPGALYATRRLRL